MAGIDVGCGGERGGGGGRRGGKGEGEEGEGEEEGGKEERKEGEGGGNVTAPGQAEQKYQLKRRKKKGTVK